MASSSKPKVKLKDFANVIQPQVGVTMQVRKSNTGTILWSGPSHYLTGGESFCDMPIKSISLEEKCLVVGV